MFDFILSIIANYFMPSYTDISAAMVLLLAFAGSSSSPVMYTVKPPIVGDSPAEESRGIFHCY